MLSRKRRRGTLGRVFYVGFDQSHIRIPDSLIRQGCVGPVLSHAMGDQPEPTMCLWAISRATTGSVRRFEVAMRLRSVLMGDKLDNVRPERLQVCSHTSR